MGSEDETCEGMEGGVVWCEDEKIKGKGKDRVYTLNVS